MWVCATPATWNDSRCEFVPRLPRKTTVGVSLCHACHAKCRGVTGAQASPSAPPSAMSATPATETTVGVSLCHACHAKCRGVTGAQASPSTPPSAMSATPATQNDGGCEFVPRLPRETKVDVRLCHACHAKWRGVTGAQASPSAPPNAICTTPATQNDGGCEFVPRLPRKTTASVSLCHACHAKCRGVTGAQASPSAPPSAMRACHAKRRWMWVCATPATWNEGGCQVVPRLPRKVARRHGRPSQSKRATQCHECHACHAKRRWMWDCATPATWNEGGCEVVPRLPRKVARRHGRPSQSKRATQCHLYHACHAKRRWMWVCATPATQNDSKYGHACHAKRRSRACHVKRRWMSGCASAPPNAMSATPATQNDGGCEIVPRLPRETKVDVRLCHACHAKWRGVTGAQASPSAPPNAICTTPATQNDGGCEFVPRLPRKNEGGCEIVAWVCVSVCVYVKFVCVKLLYVKERCVCESFVCEIIVC